jgi:hypothetical protein
VAAVNLLSTVVKANEILNTLAEDFKVFGHGRDYDMSDLYMMEDGNGMPGLLNPKMFPSNEDILKVL